MKLAELSQSLQAARNGAEVHPSVLATRVRFSRNLNERYVSQLGDQERELLRDRIFSRLADSEALVGAQFLELDKLAEHEISLLKGLVRLDELDEENAGGRGLVISSDPRLTVLVGEEDHLRISCLRDGLQIESCYACADCMDASLEELFEFAFSEEFGYLSASPWRTGTGMKVSVFVHLPALAMSEELPRIYRALGALHFSVRDPSDDGPLGQSPWAEIANARCLGEPESVYLEQLAGTVKKLDDFESRARERLLTEARSLLEDRVWSAFGQLRYGRLMPEDRAMELLGTLRLGCLTEIFQDVSIQELQEVSVRVLDGQIQAEGPLDPEDRDQRRAEILRDWLDNSKA